MNREGKVYFAADFHLGAPNREESINREKKIVRWLEQAATDAREIFLVGDVLDYWFEYRQVVPRGNTRLLGCIARITDSGIPVHWFTGNHDMWIFNYLPQETGVILHKQPLIREFDGKNFYIAHGDGLGPGDRGYKMFKKVLANKMCQWMFARMHPNFGIWLMKKSSHTSRNAAYNGREFLGEDKEWLIIHSKQLLQNQHYDFFIYGHRHLVLNLELPQNSRYINLGDWITQFHYGVWDGNEFRLEKFEG